MVYVVGGWDGFNALSSVLRYDVAADTWDECPPMSAPRNRPAAVLISNSIKIAVVGK